MNMMIQRSKFPAGTLRQTEFALWSVRCANVHCVCSAHNTQFRVHAANQRFAYHVLQAKLADLFQNYLSREADSLASIFYFLGSAPANQACPVVQPLDKSHRL